MSTSRMELLRRAIGNHLADIADLLPKEYKLTLVARHTTDSRSHIIIGDDDAAGDVVKILEHPEMTPVVVDGKQG
jgi:hypothetical protein